MSFLTFLRSAPFQAAMFVSVSLHAGIIFGGFGNSSVTSEKQATIKDFHLPVSVELVGSKLAPSTKDTIVPTSIGRHRDKPVPAPLTKSSLVYSKSVSENDYPLKATSQPNKSVIQTAQESKRAWNPPPIYPALARRMGQEGRVILEAHLDEIGRVIRVHIIRSSGFSSLDRAALDAVRKWSLDLPENGSRRLFIPVTFELKSSS